MDANSLHLYVVTADYRPENEKRPRYKCAAENKTACRRKFNKIYSWLKIYDIEEIDGTIGRDVLIL